jgi:DNA-binding GntR family transcriptional regulator
MSLLSGKIKDIDFKAFVLVEQVSRVLTEAILENVFRGGEQLIEADLQRQFGISRSPLREAFRDLEKKGLVEIVPRKGTFVKKISRRDIEEHFPVRSVLEGLAAKQAYGKLTDADLQRMGTELEQMKDAVSKGDVKAYRDNHLLFHEIFINASDNLLLIKMLKTLRMHTMWYRFSYQYYKEDLEKSWKVHKKILDLFKSKKSDVDDLEKLVRDHIAVAAGRFLVYLEDQEG